MADSAAGPPRSTEARVADSWLLGLWLALGVLASVVVALLPRTASWVLAGIVTWAAGLSIAFGIRRYRPQALLPWSLLAGAAAANGLARILVADSTAGVGGAVGLTLAFGAGLTVGVALVMLVVRSHAGYVAESLVGLLTAVVVGTFAATELLGEAGRLDVVWGLSCAYVTAAVMLSRAAGGTSLSGWLLAGGLTANTVAYLARSGGHEESGWTALFALASVVIGSAALTPSMRGLGERRPHLPGPVGVVTFVPYAAAMVVPAAILVAPGTPPDAPRVGATAVYLGFVALLSWARAALLQRRHDAYERADQAAVAASLARAEASERRLDAVLAQTGEIVLICNPGPVATWVSSGFTRVTGWKPSEVLGKVRLDIFVEDDVPMVREALARCLVSPGVPVPLLHRVIHADGSVHLYDAVLINQIDDPAIGGIIVNGRDVTGQDVAESRFAGLLELVPEALAVIDNEHRVVMANRAWSLLFGVEEGEAAGRPFTGLLHDEDRDRAEAYLRSALANGRVAYPCMARHQRADGSPFWAEFRVQVQAGRAGSAESALVWWTARTAAPVSAPRVAGPALSDQLTGLGGLADAVAQVDRALGEGAGARVAVFYCDLDHFHGVNERHGRAGGDAMLVEMSRRLIDAAGPEQGVNRVGGDDFVVVCPNAPRLRDAERLAQRLLSALSQPVVIGSMTEVVTASIGVALAGPETDGVEAETMLRWADLAAYRAKEQGRNRVAFYDPSLHARDEARLAAELDLRRGLAAGEFVAYFQPIWRVRDKRVVSAEALVRWHHPERGLVGPGAFIPLAEASGLIVDMGETVLAQSIAQAADWQRRYGALAPTVEVNLSARQLGDVALVDELVRLITAHDLSPGNLTLEVTESTIMEDADRAAEILRRISDMGVGLAIDDFGTGYSSLERLRRLPFNMIKIDRTFVAGLGEHPEDGAVVAASIRLAGEFGLTCLAEGVETEDQRAALEILGCPLAQGWLVAPALPAAEFENLLRSAALG